MTDTMTQTATAATTVDPKTATIEKTADAGMQDGADATAQSASAGAGGAAQHSSAAEGTDWSSDWREKLAAGDADELKRLQRYSSPPDIWKKTRELEKKLSSGEYRTKLPDNATPEQIADWRKDMGIPDSPDGYDTNVEGVVFSDIDKPVINSFAKAMHDANADPKAVKAGLAWYTQHLEEVQAQRAQADHDAEVEVKVELGKEWGAEAKINYNLINSTLEQFPNLKAAIWEARTQNGQGGYVGYTKGVLQELAQLSRELNPAATILPQGGNNAEALKTEMEKLEAKMGTNNYTQADRQRYVALVELRDKTKARAA